MYSLYSGSRELVVCTDKSRLPSGIIIKAEAVRRGRVLLHDDDDGGVRRNRALYFII